MTEWEVMGVITALVGFAAAIVAPIVKLNTNITRLTVTLNGLSKEADKREIDNTDGHRRLWNSVDAHTAELNAHDKRITVIERTEKKR